MNRLAEAKWGKNEKLRVAVELEVGLHRSVTHAPFHWYHGKYGITEIKMVSQPSGIPHANTCQV